MTIHSEHPFATPEGDRNPVRRLRGRLPLPVSVWTAAAGGRRAGWTVSSMLIAEGDPAEVLGLVDEDSDFADRLRESGTVAVSLLDPRHRALADAFAGVAPAPGGPFQLAAWTDTDWGPVLTEARGWLGARIDAEPGHAGWALLVRGRIDHVELGSSSEPALAYLGGRYRPIQGTPTLGA